MKLSSFRACAVVDDLPRFVETLQGKGMIGEIPVNTHPLRCKAHGLLRDFDGFLILPLCAVHGA